MSSDDLLTELEDTFTEFSLELRMGNGLNQEIFSNLCKIINLCRQEWEMQDCIPKKAAAIFVGSYETNMASSDLYEDNERLKIKNAVSELDNLIYMCLYN